MPEIREALEFGEAAAIVIETLGASRIDGPTPEFTKEAVSVGNLIVELALTAKQETFRLEALLKELDEMFGPYAAPRAGAEGPEVGFRKAAEQVVKILTRYYKEEIHE